MNCSTEAIPTSARCHCLSLTRLMCAVHGATSLCWMGMTLYPGTCGDQHVCNVQAPRALPQGATVEEMDEDEAHGGAGRHQHHVQEPDDENGGNGGALRQGC